jgi:hypothetical protein
MRTKFTAGLFMAGVMFLFTPGLWMYFQNESLRAAVALPNLPALEAYGRFSAGMDAHGQVSFWATGVALVLAAFLSLRRCRPA